MTKYINIVTKIDWFCSAWDIDSLKFLRKYNCKYSRVASAMLTNLELIKHIAKKKKLHLFLLA